MKIILTVFTFLFLIINCFSQTIIHTNDPSVKNIEILDTIIERNNPKALDFSKHQLFIDTTRTYVFYKKMEKWDPLKQISSQYLFELFNDSIFTKVDLKNFPKIWVTLIQYQGEFMLFDRCNGTEPTYVFNDSLFYICGVHEGDLRKIKKVNTEYPKEFIFELKSFQNDGIEEPIIFHFQITSRSDVYKLTIEFNNEIYSEFVTSKENIRNFDLLVNHCPNNEVTQEIIEIDRKYGDWIKLKTLPNKR